MRVRLIIEDGDKCKEIDSEYYKKDIKHMSKLKYFESAMRTMTRYMIDEFGLK